jgi:hypothetical protein
MHVSLARTILETLKVEMTAAHLNQTRIAPVSVTPRTVKLLHEVGKSSAAGP